MPPDTPRILSAPSRCIQDPGAPDALPKALAGLGLPDLREVDHAAIARPALDATSITHPPASPGLPRLTAWLRKAGRRGTAP